MSKYKKYYIDHNMYFKYDVKSLFRVVIFSQNNYVLNNLYQTMMIIVWEKNYQRIFLR